MKYNITLLIIIITLSACTKRDNRKVIETSETPSEVKKEQNTVDIADLPIYIDSTNYMIHPIGNYKIQKSRSKYYSGDSFYSGDYRVANYNGYKIAGDLSNVKFQNINSDVLKPLTNEVIKIHQISFLFKIFKETKNGYYVYDIIDEDTNSNGKLDQKDLDFFNDMKEKEKYDNFDADRLMDYDGHTWSGVIVHQDTTQKVVPGERIISYRCLVSIGNRKGAGGFGMGKGADADIALRNAFRDALKNMIYIDLYENAALAHDLKGKHNDCIVYIRATPKAREMVASPLATSIFNSFGIVSCSAKIVGNRHPYSMVRAIYNALAKHKNTDEIAKERGTRYLLSLIHI